MKSLSSYTKNAVVAIRRWCLTHRKFAIAIKALIQGLPPALWAYALIKFSIALPFQQDAHDFFEAHKWLPLCVLIWPLVSTVLFEALADFTSALATSGDAGSAELLALVTAIDDIVGRKLNRFGEYARELRDGRKSKSVFADITQPQRQIEALVQSLWQMLSTLTQDRTLKVVLACMEKDLPVRWYCHFPNDALPSSDLLKAEAAKKTFFAHCSKDKRPVLIEDIAQYIELRRKKKAKGKKNKQATYIVGNASTDSTGSIIAYPIINHHLSELPFVLSVKSDTNTINAAFKEKHKFIVEAFIKRLVLEHNLLSIKNGVTYDYEAPSQPAS
ncbi:MAG: hypothetical protein Q7J29_02255 [Stagnimonas sp.]|nr:hypothetical protein [Stagnimonas sp.]